MASPGKLTLRVKSKKSQNAVLRDVDVKETVKDLLVKLSTLTEVPHEQIAILKGFPPKRISLNRSDPVEALGLQHQDTIIVEVDSAEQLGAAGITPPSSEAGGATVGVKPSISETERAANGKSSNSPADGGMSYADLIPSSDDGEGLLLRQIVPSDNSCLFTSVTYCLSGQLPTDSEGGSSFLREMIANTVAADTEKYNEAILGRPNQDYVNWIKKPESWGGGIELAILAEFYGIQISVVDTQSLHISCFGEDQNYGQRMFIIYDGIHYDPLYFEPFTGNSMTIFPTTNSKMMDLAMQLAQEAKASHQFTDLKNFSLRCQVCNTPLKGQEEAQAHAKKTAHASFAEIIKK